MTSMSRLHELQLAVQASQRRDDNFTLWSADVNYPFAISPEPAQTVPQPIPCKRRRADPVEPALNVPQPSGVDRLHRLGRPS